MPKGQDVMISVYNIHHSPAVWDEPEAFRPDRFPLDAPPPTEQNTDYRYIPFRYIWGGASTLWRGGWGANLAPWSPGMGGRVACARGACGCKGGRR